MWRVIIIFSLFLFLVVGCARQSTYEPVVVMTPLKKPKQTIVIDAGHGGKDPGSESERYHYVEKELTLTTARLVSDYLRDLGYHTIMTRDEDRFLSLKERAEVANSKKADLFVSVHYNYSASKEVEGIEVFFYEEATARKTASAALGRSVLSKIIKHTNCHSRGVKAGNYAVIRETKMPAILVEGGFLSNPEERKKIKDPQYVHFLAYGIAKGVDAYLEGK